MAANSELIVTIIGLSIIILLFSIMLYFLMVDIIKSGIKWKKVGNRLSKKIVENDEMLD